MEFLEKLNRAVAGWYEGLFGASGDVRPRDILRQILQAMEQNRKEGLDGKTYVPNRYVLELSVSDPEEKEYIVSFLDRDELEAAVKRFCKQNGYQIRGPLDFTIAEVDVDPDDERAPKVRVKCRYSPVTGGGSGSLSESPANRVIQPSALSLQPSEPSRPSGDDLTVAHDATDSDLGTIFAVPHARLEITQRGTSRNFEIMKESVLIGRSGRADNDVVIADDGQASRRHVRITHKAEGGFLLEDLETTNGTRVNGERVDHAELKDGDEILIGSTRIVFRTSEEVNIVPATQPISKPVGTQNLRPRLVQTTGDADLETFILSDDTIIGRAITNDMVLTDRSVAQKHVQIRLNEVPLLTVLDADHITLLNGKPITIGKVHALRSGDRVGVGTVTLRFEDGAH